jgi:GT2 family glycosyltransferase
VVIVTFDSREMTLGCVRSLPAAPWLRTIVVDNGSTDGSADALRKQLGERGEVVTLPEGVGYAAANNLGAERGTAPLLLFLNSDIVCPAGSVEALQAAVLEDPAAVAAGGRLVDPGTDDTQPGYRPRRFPSVASLAVILLGVEKMWPGNPVSRRFHAMQVDEDATRAVEAQPAAAALIVRRDAFERVSGFDERFWFWFEDSDLLRRLTRVGNVLWVPAAPFEHLGGAGFSDWGRVAHIRSLHHGLLTYTQLQMSRSGRALLGALAVAVSLPRVALFARARPEEARAWRDVARGGWALLRGRPVPAIAGRAKA